MTNGAIGTTLLGENRMSVRVGKSVNDPPLSVMFPEDILSGVRLATIPDLVDVLLHGGLKQTPLPPYVTTLSAEYAGLSRTGIPLIVVAHGVGPMSTPALAYEFYKGASNRLAYKERGFWKHILAEKNSPYKDDADFIQSRTYNKERVQCLAQDSKFQKEFWKLCDGDYGQVEIIEMRALGRELRNIAGGSELSVEEAHKNPLIRAWFGGRSESFFGGMGIHKKIHSTSFTFKCVGSTYDSIDRYADLHRGPVGYLLTFEKSYTKNTVRLSTGFWRPGFAVRFVQISGDGPLTEIRRGFGDIRF